MNFIGDFIKAARGGIKERDDKILALQTEVSTVSAERDKAMERQAAAELSRDTAISETAAAARMCDQAVAQATAAEGRCAEMEKLLREFADEAGFPIPVAPSPAQGDSAQPAASGSNPKT